MLGEGGQTVGTYRGAGIGNEERGEVDGWWRVKDEGIVREECGGGL